MNFVECSQSYQCCCHLHDKDGSDLPFWCCKLEGSKHYHYQNKHFENFNSIFGNTKGETFWSKESEIQNAKTSIINHNIDDPNTFKKIFHAILQLEPNCGNSLFRMLLSNDASEIYLLHNELGSREQFERDYITLFFKCFDRYNSNLRMDKTTKVQKAKSTCKDCKFPKNCRRAYFSLFQTKIIPHILLCSEIRISQWREKMTVLLNAC